MDRPAAEVGESQRTTDRAGGRLGSLLRDRAAAIEERDALDGVSDALAALGGRFESRPALRRALRGEWLGHALHPLLTDFPLGAWMSASLLDLWGGEETEAAARKLLLFGVVAAIPTAITGVVEAASAGSRARRVAAVHACVNGTALTLYALSLAARRRERRSRATLLGVAGGLVATVGGYFGGHLSLVLGVGAEAGSGTSA